MKRRIALLSMLILSLVLLPGCPSAGSALVGGWKMTFSGNLHYGIQLNANGEATSFVVDQFTLGGTLTWDIVGTRVLIHQDIANSRTVYAAELTSDTTMSGAYVRWSAQGLGISGTWTAVKLF